MKTILGGIILVFIAFFYCSCGSGNAKIETAPEEIVVDTIIGEAPYVPPPPIVAEPKSDSPFYELGCCKDTETSVDDCCCLKVLEKYAELRKKGDKRIAQFKQTDVLLSNCISHKNYSAKFNAIDYPEGDDDF